MSEFEFKGEIGAELAAGLVVAQAAAGSVYKGRQSGGDGGGPRYKYASSEDVAAVAKEALEAGGLAVLQLNASLVETDRISTTYKAGTAQAYTVVGDVLRVEYLLIHKSGQSVRIVTQTPVIPGSGRPWDKAVAAAQTYSMGYVLRGILLLIRTDEKEEVDARDDRDAGPAHHSSPPPPKQQSKPKAPPVSTTKIKEAVNAAFPGSSVGEAKIDVDAIAKEIGGYTHESKLGLAAVQEIGNKHGSRDARTPEQWLAFRRAVETRWQEALNNASTDRWDLYVKELGEKVTDEIAAMVSDHEGQPPEDWSPEQLLRALRMAEKRQKDVPQ